jgi:AcrR family transcriptional regulator
VSPEAADLKYPTGRRNTQPRSIATRAAIVAAARSLFGEVGYYATGTNEIVARADVTRGALYHHFKNKEALFEAVYIEANEELSGLANDQTRAFTGMHWQHTLATLRAYLSTVASRADIRQILLIDGQNVLGWRRWRELQTEYRLANFEKTLEVLTDAGEIPDRPREQLAYLLMALLNDAALSVAHAGDQKADLEEISSSLEVLVNGLRVRS